MVITESQRAEKMCAGLKKLVTKSHAIKKSENVLTTKMTKCVKDGDVEGACSIVRTLQRERNALRVKYSRACKILISLQRQKEIDYEPHPYFEQ